MQSIVFAVLCTLAVANAGLTSVVQTVNVAHPVVHTVNVAPVHHAPLVHTIAHPVVHTSPVLTAVHTAPLYKTAVIPTAYATSYKYRAAPAKIVVAHNVVAAAPQPLYKTIVPTSYASSYSYRAPPAKVVVHKTVVAAPVVHTVAHPVVHHHAPLVHAVHPVVHSVAHPTVLLH